MLPTQRSLHTKSVALRPKLNKKIGHDIERQFQGLLNTIRSITAENDELLTLVSEREQTSDYSLQELTDTLQLFEDFAKTYYRIVNSLTSRQGNERRSQAVRKIQQEVFVLRRLLEQRSSSHLRPVLRLADRWCNVYLTSLLTPTSREQTASPPLQRSLVAYVTDNMELGAGAPMAGFGALAIRSNYRNWCLTFFESEHHIRMGKFAYNRNPTISIPLIYALEPWNWLATAHEIGHFVFNNTDIVIEGQPTALERQLRQAMFGALARKYVSGDGPMAPRANQVANYDGMGFRGYTQPCLGIAYSIPLWCTWAEEVFADVLGAFTLGPAYIESLIACVAPLLPDANSLLLDDGDHPIACLRPILQLLVHLSLLERHQTEATDLKRRLGEVAAEWFAFCEHHFDAARWPDTAQNTLTGCDLSTTTGILQRLGVWSKYLRHRIGAVPLQVILDQVKDIVEAYVETLDGIDVYDAVTHERTLAFAKAIQANVPLSDQQIDADFCLFLSAQWYRQRRGVAFGTQQQTRWLRLTEHLDRPQTIVPSQVDAGSWQAVQAVLTPLLGSMNGVQKEEWDVVRGSLANGTPAEPEAALALADRILAMSFATAEPIFGTASRTCAGDQVPHCNSWSC